MERLREKLSASVERFVVALALLVTLTSLTGCTGGGVSVLWGNPEVVGPGGVVYEYTVAGSESGQPFAAVLCRTAPGEPPPQFVWGLHEGAGEGDVWFEVDGKPVATDAGFVLYLSDRAGMATRVKREEAAAQRVFARDAKPDFAVLDELWQRHVLPSPSSQNSSSQDPSSQQPSVQQPSLQGQVAE